MEVKMEMRKRGMGFQEKESEWRLPGLLYAENLVLCIECWRKTRGKWCDVLLRCAEEEV